jgi:hypothetical protein
MSQQSATESSEPVGHRSLSVHPSVSASTARTGALGVALLLTASLTLVRVVRNAPVDAPGVASAPALLLPATQVVAGLAVVLVGLTTDRRSVRTALVFAGVFAVLAAVGSAASVPAVGALVVGGAVLVGTDARTHAETPRRWLVGGLVLTGVVASLAAVLGVATATLRPLGTTLALVGLAVVPLLVDPPRAAWLAGGAVAGGVLAVGLAAPFVVGAVTLVSTAVVGASLPLLALGLGGATVAAVGFAQTGHRPAALGVALLALAGVPATVPRATLVVLGLAAVLGDGGARR